MSYIAIAYVFLVIHNTTFTVETYCNKKATRASNIGSDYMGLYYNKTALPFILPGNLVSPLNRFQASRGTVDPQLDIIFVCGHCSLCQM